MSDDNTNLIKVTKTVITQYDIYLNDDVNDINEYKEIAHTLSSATRNDLVKLHLGNFGGSTHACIYLVNYIRHSEAPVLAVISAPCYSAGATLALCGDGIEMRQNTFLMFHNYSSRPSGKGEELLTSVEHTDRWIHQYFKDIHYPFLSKAELNYLKQDRDIYIHYNDPSLITRCERHFKKRK